MNPNNSQFPISHVKVINDAMEERGWHPEEREDRLGAKVNAFDLADHQHASEASVKMHATNYKNREMRKNNTVPVVKVKS